MTTEALALDQGPHGTGIGEDAGVAAVQATVISSPLVDPFLDQRFLGGRERGPGRGRHAFVVGAVDDSVELAARSIIGIDLVHDVPVIGHANAVSGRGIVMTSAHGAIGLQQGQYIIHEINGIGASGSRYGDTGVGREGLVPATGTDRSDQQNEYGRIGNAHKIQTYVFIL